MQTARQQQFSKEYNAWNQGDVGGSLSLGNTSKFLQDLGVSEGNVYWDKAKIVASKKNHPDLTDSVMKQVPQLLDDPLLVMQSRTGAKRFAFIGNVLDDQGKPVLAALVLEPTGAGNRVVKFAKIPGGNVRYNALEGLKKSGDVLYQNPGKSMSGMEVQASSTQWSEGGSGAGNNANKVENFTNVKDLDDFISRLPADAKELPWKEVPGGALEGVKYKWTDVHGNVWQVRAHSADLSAPVGSNASQGWIYRVEVRYGGKGKTYYIDSTGTPHMENVLNPKSPMYNESIANDTHIPFGQ